MNKEKFKQAIIDRFKNTDSGSGNMTQRELILLHIANSIYQEQIKLNGITKRLFCFDYTGNGYIDNGNLVADLLTEEIYAYDEEHAILLFKKKFVNVPFDPPY